MKFGLKGTGSDCRILRYRADARGVFLVMPLATSLLFLAFAWSGQHDQQLPSFDGQYQPPVAVSTYAPDCGGTSAFVRYREERLDPESVGLISSLRVTLLELRVSGHRLPRSDFQRVSGLFREFAWIRRLDAVCYRGTLTLSVNGMPLREFIESVRHRTPLPELRTRTVLFADGMVSIS